jgi:hypothetical protein
VLLKPVTCVNDAGRKFAAGINDTGGNLTPVETGGKFETGVSDTVANNGKISGC